MRCLHIHVLHSVIHGTSICSIALAVSPLIRWLKTVGSSEKMNGSGIQGPRAALASSSVNTLIRGIYTRLGIALHEEIAAHIKKKNRTLTCMLIRSITVDLWKKFPSKTRTPSPGADPHVRTSWGPLLALDLGTPGIPG